MVSFFDEVENIVGKEENTGKPLGSNCVTGLGCDVLNILQNV